jgi:undecaprenyl-diphosphatase
LTPIEALILGIIQGLTEFFPVSSSAHLKLGEYFLGMRDLHNYIFFDLICHFGTLFAIFFVFRDSIKAMFTTNKKLFWQLCLATLPLFPLVLIMKPIRALFDNMTFLGFFMMLNACFLFFAIKTSVVLSPLVREKRCWRDTLIIGLAQACAILPGISRSGSTISTAWLRGWDTKSAITFSFLLSIPAVLGGIAYELLKVFVKHETLLSDSIGWTSYLIGFLASGVVGIFCLLLLLRLFNKERFLYFAWYCLVVGAIVAIYFGIMNERAV